MIILKQLELSETFRFHITEINKNEQKTSFMFLSFLFLVCSVVCMFVVLKSSILSTGGTICHIE